MPFVRKKRPRRQSFGNGVSRRIARGLSLGRVFRPEHVDSDPAERENDDDEEGGEDFEDGVIMVESRPSGLSPRSEEKIEQDGHETGEESPEQGSVQEESPFDWLESCRRRRGSFKSSYAQENV